MKILVFVRSFSFLSLLILTILSLFYSFDLINLNEDIMFVVMVLFGLMAIITSLTCEIKEYEYLPSFLKSNSNEKVVDFKPIHFILFLFIFFTLLITVIIIFNSFGLDQAFNVFGHIFLLFIIIFSYFSNYILEVLLLIIGY